MEFGGQCGRCLTGEVDSVVVMGWGVRDTVFDYRVGLYVLVKNMKTDILMASGSVAHGCTWQ